jgi:hypothetical protein
VHPDDVSAELPFDLEMIPMTDIRQTRSEEEPIGIVISGGARGESAPRFAAYVWSQVNEVIPAQPEPRAA